MTYGAEIWGPPLIAAASSWLSGKGNASKETKMQKTQRNLIDQLLASLSGGGPYSDLFNVDQEAFQKSFVDPAKQMFNSQIAPQIQQQSIAGGQQRSSGLDSNLARAGIDLDQMLNQYMYQSQQDALNRKQNVIGGILGAGAGAPNETTSTQDILSGIGGSMSSSGFSDAFANLFKNPQANMSSNNLMAQGANQTRKGFLK